MKFNKLSLLVLALCTSFIFVQCGDDDDNGNILDTPTCSDQIQNGDEEGVDCGGSACEACPVAMDEGPDFSGTYQQQDIMGRPGINTVFGSNDEVKNNYNVSLTHERAGFQAGFQATTEAYYAAFGAEYENNILGMDLPTLTTVLATTDALQVAPNAATSYFTPGGTFLTGRTLNDDVIDVSLILIFGGQTGDRFNGENGTPELVSDNVGFGDREISAFPYMTRPNM
ncbi:MAG: hypothetical protein ACPG7E_01385 [Marinirhabdus sp.]